jgi:hypothetical protein
MPTSKFLTIFSNTQWSTQNSKLIWTYSFPKSWKGKQSSAPFIYEAYNMSQATFLVLILECTLKYKMKYENQIKKLSVHMKNLCLVWTFLTIH